MKWFKHYNDASIGHTLSNLWANNDTEAIALFWLIHELVSRFEDENSRGFVKISWSLLARDTNWKPTKCRRVLARISSVSKIEPREEIGGYVSFLIPNWLKFQENRGGKKLAKKEQNLDRGKKREVRREIPDAETSLFENKIFEIWNQNRGKLPEALSLTKKRARSLNERWKENPDHDFWVACVKKLATSDFCVGKNDRGWIATIDFLARPDTCVKVFEGAYDNKKKKNPNGMVIET